MKTFYDSRGVAGAEKGLCQAIEYIIKLAGESCCTCSSVYRYICPGLTTCFRFNRIFIIEISCKTDRQHITHTPCSTLCIHIFRLTLLHISKVHLLFTIIPGNFLYRSSPYLCVWLNIEINNWQLSVQHLSDFLFSICQLYGSF